MALPSPSFTETGFLMTSIFLNFPCGRVPTFLSILTNGRALPSMMGTSKESISTTALSSPMPQNADIRCSMVETVLPLSPMVVARVVSQTDLKSAGIGLAFGRSFRTKTMPVSAEAGLICILTLRPVCRPMLEQNISFFKVRCKCMLLSFLS